MYINAECQYWATAFKNFADQIKQMCYIVLDAVKHLKK